MTRDRHDGQGGHDSDGQVNRHGHYDHRPSERPENERKGRYEVEAELPSDRRDDQFQDEEP